jgi:hypothetical protein
MSGGLQRIRLVIWLLGGLALAATLTVIGGRRVHLALTAGAPVRLSLREYLDAPPATPRVELTGCRPRLRESTIVRGSGAATDVREARIPLEPAPATATAAPAPPAARGPTLELRTRDPAICGAIGELVRLTTDVRSAEGARQLYDQDSGYREFVARSGARPPDPTDARAALQAFMDRRLPEIEAASTFAGLIEDGALIHGKEPSLLGGLAMLVPGVGIGLVALLALVGLVARRA